ncbi:MAG: hypothetical protein AVDCRST_MAG75-743 [uncultured Propionibacteriaceae bacterium]|uniref:Uncharacterized protein n=1 Tax=uncultured Propionibacteriaceae bacterium TaxID=257457 RepID=A0A6J4N588_9ACTN|nr:MAG: hypothetical protein AVDCRST_MAG75-743 [uncultured Propionibacteriaceae bacterium]
MAADLPSWKHRRTRQWSTAAFDQPSRAVGAILQIPRPWTSPEGSAA